MTLLALDPSSTRTGYAVFGNIGQIVCAGYFKPRVPKAGAMDRVASMVEDLAELLGEHKPRRVVIEVPSGKVGGGQRRGAGASLCIYGFAVGAMWATCRAYFDRQHPELRGDLHTVDERTWTRCVPKKMRQSRIAAEFPRYREVMAKDGGADVADAIGIGLWWMAQRKAKGLTG